MTYNIHAGLGSAREGVWDRFYRGEYDLEPVIRCIREADPDLVALQEVAVLDLYGRTLDQPRALAQALGMSYRFGAADSVVIPAEGGSGRGTYLFGNAVLSRFPIKGSRLHCLYRPGEDEEVDPPGTESFGAGMTYGQGSPGWREPRALLVAEIDTGRGRLRFGSTHLSYVGQRQVTRQAEQVARTLMTHEEPVVVAGDLNRRADSSTLAPLRAGFQHVFLADGRIDMPVEERLTWPTGVPIRDLDHIFVSQDLAIADARVLTEHPEASDHYPVVADVCIPS